MKKNSEITNLNRIDKVEPESGKRDVQHTHEAVKSQALAALNSLRLGERPALSAQQREEAAGLLGNQNVLKLMETGAEVQRALAEAAAEVDTQALAGVLSGPPDGPVCAMETLL